MSEDRPLPRAVLGWSREDQELFIQMAGKQLDDGKSPAMADQIAMTRLAKERKARSA